MVALNAYKIYFSTVNKHKNNYSIGCAFLGILGFFTIPKLKSCKESWFVAVSENFTKVINDKEKENLVEINSDKIKNLILKQVFHFIQQMENIEIFKILEYIAWINTQKN